MARARPWRGGDGARRVFAFLGGLLALPISAASRSSLRWGARARAIESLTTGNAAGAGRAGDALQQMRRAEWWGPGGSGGASGQVVECFAFTTCGSASLICGAQLRPSPRACVRACVLGMFPRPHRVRLRSFSHLQSVKKQSEKGDVSLRLHHQLLCCAAVRAVQMR
jgi:hypothetical protein